MADTYLTDELLARGVTAAVLSKARYLSGDAGEDCLTRRTSVADRTVVEVAFFDDRELEASGGTWMYIGGTDLGPVGMLGFRTVWGQTIPTGMNPATKLSDLGIVTGDTLTLNGNSVTVVANGATGNQVNATDYVKQLFLRIQDVMTASTGFGNLSRIEIFGSKIVIQSSAQASLPTNTSLVVTGTMGAKIGLANKSYAFTNAITIEGLEGRWQFLPGIGSVHDIRQFGFVVDGVTIANFRTLRYVISGHRMLGYKLVGPQGSKENLTHRLRISRTVDCRRLCCDIGFQIGSYVKNGGASPKRSGDYYNDAAQKQYDIDEAAWIAAGSDPATEPTEPNSGIDQFDIQQPDGTTLTVGIGVMAGGDASNGLFLRQRFDIRGDGNSDFTVDPTCKGFVSSNDNSGLATTDFAVTYCKLGHCLSLNQEKNRFDGYFAYNWLNTYNHYNPSNGDSPDTVHYRMTGQDCIFLWWDSDGADTSVRLDLMFESRVDPETTMPGKAWPGIWFRGGKINILVGQGRAWNGEVGILVDKNANLGVDSFFVDFLLIHSHTMTDIRRVRNLIGQYVSKDSDNVVQGAVRSNPHLRLGRIVNGGGFYSALVTQKGREALRIGIEGAQADARYSIDADLGLHDIVMAGFVPFNSDGSENTAAFPTNSTGCVIEKMKGGRIRFNQIEGKINVLAGSAASATGAPEIHVPRAHRKYTRTRTGGGVADFFCSDGQPLDVLSA